MQHREFLITPLPARRISVAPRCTDDIPAEPSFPLPLGNGVRPQSAGKPRKTVPFSRHPTTVSLACSERSAYQIALHVPRCQRITSSNSSITFAVLPCCSAVRALGVAKFLSTKDEFQEKLVETFPSIFQRTLLLIWSGVSVNSDKKCSWLSSKMIISWEEILKHLNVHTAFSPSDL